MIAHEELRRFVVANVSGRYPANIIHDGSKELVKSCPSTVGDNRGKCHGKRPGGFACVGEDKGDSKPNAMVYPDSGSAARFFKECPSDD